MSLLISHEVAILIALYNPIIVLSSTENTLRYHSTEMVTALFIEHLLYTEHYVSSLNIHEADVIESLT